MAEGKNTHKSFLKLYVRTDEFKLNIFFSFYNKKLLLNRWNPFWLLFFIFIFISENERLDNEIFESNSKFNRIFYSKSINSIFFYHHNQKYYTFNYPPIEKKRKLKLSTSIGCNRVFFIHLNFIVLGDSVNFCFFFRFWNIFLEIELTTQFKKRKTIKQVERKKNHGNGSTKASSQAIQFTDWSLFGEQR